MGEIDFANVREAVRTAAGQNGNGKPKAQPPAPPVIEMVRTSELKPAPFNPADRIQPRNIKGLMKEIEKDGIMSPLQVTSDGYVADGHRRLACAEALGIEYVPVIRTKKTLDEAWSGLNGATRAVNGKAWASAFVGGLDSQYIPADMRQSAEELYRILGDDFADVMSRRSLYIYKQARHVARYIGDTSDDTIKKIILWMDRNNAQRKLSNASEAGAPVDVIKKAIETGSELRYTWSVS